MLVNVRLPYFSIDGSLYSSHSQVVSTVYLLASPHFWQTKSYTLSNRDRTRPNETFIIAINRKYVSLVWAWHSGAGIPNWGAARKGRYHGRPEGVGGGVWQWGVLLPPCSVKDSNLKKFLGEKEKIQTFLWKSFFF